MSRHSTLRAVVGLVVLALALCLVLLSRGVAEAARAFDDAQAQWQRGTVARIADEPGPLRSAGERLLGIRSRSDLLRAYLAYRMGLADVIPGTTFPQTQARWNAIAAIDGLRPSLSSGHDRAVADVTLGYVYAGGALAAGPGNQRKTLRDNAVSAFRRGALEDPANADAKHGLELLLMEAREAAARARREPDRRGAEDKPTATPRTQPEGAGY